MTMSRRLSKNGERLIACEPGGANSGSAGSMRKVDSGPATKEGSVSARIMVVEDEGIVALDIQSKLEGLGYEVPAVVASAADAIHKAGQIRPDLILMDIQLEGDVDGVEAATQINRQLQIPVIYLTAYSDENTLERAKMAEPMGYLLKPFEERELYAAVEIALYKRGTENEKARLEERLKQSEKMEAIGQLSAGLAYNFNNMLHGVIGNLDLASMQAPDELRPFLEDAAYDATAAAKLMSQLMQLYRQEQIEHSGIDVNGVIVEVASMCREIFSAKISITVDGDSGVPTVSGNRDQLRQSLVNLCTNARDAVLEEAHGTDSGDSHFLGFDRIPTEKSRSVRCREVF